MEVCWFCETQLTKDNRSSEHIIHKRLGGRRTVNNFLCRRCNNQTGAKWDAPLIESLKPWDFVASSRDWHEADPPPSYDLANRRNRHDSVSGNETRTMYRGGGDSVVSMDGGELHFEIASPSEVHTSEILRGIQRKFSISHDKWAEIEKRLSSRLLKTNSESHTVQTQVSVAFPAASRAMVKSMLALACTEGMNPVEFQGILAPWRADNHHCLGDLPDWEVLPLEERINRRCVAISGSAETRVLFGFVDFCGALPWIVPLIVPYEGPPRHAAYALDMKTGEDVNISPNMERPRAKTVAMETATRLAEMVTSEEGLSPEEAASRAASGQVPSGDELRSIAELFAPGIRGAYNLSRESFNEIYRLPVGLPPINECGYYCEGPQ